MDAKAVTAFQMMAKEAGEKLELAGAFLEDGALATASKMYREAANLIELANAQRNAAMGAPVDHDASKRQGWTIVMNDAQVFCGEAGDALMTYDGLLRGEFKRLKLLTPDKNVIAIAFYAGSGGISR